MSTPKASIVIATYKRPDLIARCLDKLAPGMQTASSADYEVIVADDDPERSAIPMLQENYPWVVLAYGPSKGPSGARNTAAAFAKGELLIFTDDDCIPHHEWVSAYMDAHAKNQVMVGKTTCEEGCTDPFDHAPLNLDGKVRFGCNLALSRENFEQLKGFDEGYMKYGFEDYDFFTRCDLAGMSSLFVPDAIVDHPPRNSGSAIRNTQTLINQYRYILKFEKDPSLNLSVRQTLQTFKDRIRRPAPLKRKIQYFFHVMLYLILMISLYERLLRKAQLSLHPYA